MLTLLGGFCGCYLTIQLLFYVMQVYNFDFYKNDPFCSWSTFPFSAQVAWLLPDEYRGQIFARILHQLHQGCCKKERKHEYG